MVNSLSPQRKTKGPAECGSVSANGHAINPKKLADLEKLIPYLPIELRQFHLDLHDHPTSGYPDTEYGEECTGLLLP